MTLSHVDVLTDTRLDSELTRDEIVARNLAVIEAHFHNENPEDVEKAVALYADDISWEAPSRGMIYTDPKEVLSAYHDIFKTVGFHKTTSLRRFATEQFVFDDQIAEVTVIGDKMPNLPYPIGTRMNMRLVHIFEMRDGRISREIAYELWRAFGSAEDNDAIPEGSVVEEFPDFELPTAGA
ncbi:nuclear transport factor 2 family protein [Streptomyces sp. NBC_00878]|uniref:nuclear transport factor 2 family protein n=1 Tax=Streptomyces sp. NBC_00878 TaxID=2975854 RepID=UPI00224E6F19|nr:nuclear transport factor 2 family protein [Streptomyces sp. NBC_00878]MCX4909894.1 nuclear transport factor 2 family protein [Streptomyces sp. NBC_00878]